MALRAALTAISRRSLQGAGSLAPLAAVAQSQGIAAATSAWTGPRLPSFARGHSAEAVTEVISAGSGLDTVCRRRRCRRAARAPSVQRSGPLCPAPPPPQREAKLPETTGWGSTQVGQLLKSKVRRAGGQSRWQPCLIARVFRPPRPRRAQLRGASACLAAWAGRRRVQGPMRSSPPPRHSCRRGWLGGWRLAACPHPTASTPCPRPVNTLPHHQEDDSGAWLWCAADDMVIDAVRKVRGCGWVCWQARKQGLAALHRPPRASPPAPAWPHRAAAAPQPPLLVDAR